MINNEIETRKLRAQTIKKIASQLERLSLTELTKVSDSLATALPLTPINSENYENGKTDFLMERKKYSEETYRVYKRVIFQFEDFSKIEKSNLGK